MRKKKQFIEFLFKQFTYGTTKKENAKRTVSFILTNIIRIAHILGMKERVFYSTADDEHLEYYELLKIELLEMGLTDALERSLKYVYRNYLEFIGNNPEPISRRGAYQNRNHHFKYKGSLKNERDFFKWIADDPFKRLRNIKNIIHSIKSGITKFCNYENLTPDEFYTFNYKEIKILFDKMFNSSKKYPFTCMSHENKIKYSIIRYLKFLNRDGSIKDEINSPRRSNALSKNELLEGKKVVINRKQNGEVVIQIF